MYNSFSDWLDSVLAENTFAGVKAFNFNLYEDCENGNAVFSVQLIGAPAYDAEDSDWACEEIFSTGENLFYISDCDDWDECLQIFADLLEEYFEKGKYANKLKDSEAVAYGFVDGDLEIAYEA